MIKANKEHNPIQVTPLMAKILYKRRLDSFYQEKDHAQLKHLLRAKGSRRWL